VQRADARIAAPGEHHLVNAAHADELVVDEVRRHPDQRQALALLADDFVAGAAGLPFAVMRGYTGTDLPAHTGNIASIDCPFTGETLTAVPALRPDVTVIHAQRADRRGNVQMWGITGVQKEAVLAADRSLVTVEEIVDDHEPVPGQVVLPRWAVTAVAEAPSGAHPSYAHGYSERDNDFYVRWDAVSRDRDTFLEWMNANVLADADGTTPDLIGRES
jgi:glutaconate CoA-transferase subunit A